MKTTFKLVPCILLMGVGVCRADILYLTAGDQHTMFLVDVSAATATSKPTGTQGYEYAIAVTGNVAIQSAYNNIAGAQTGSQYDLNGNPTGIHYTNTYGNQLLDGTTNGTNFYAITFDRGDVVRFDQNWANPQVAFSLGAGHDLIGLTYDPSDNAFWIASGSGDSISEYSTTGTFLRSSSIDGLTALALDPADGTLWAYKDFTGTLFHYSDTGALLGTETIPQLTSYNILGGEFSTATPPAAVPEPTSILLLGSVLGLVGFRFWKTSPSPRQ